MMITKQVTFFKPTPSEYAIRIEHNNHCAQGAVEAANTIFFKINTWRLKFS
jgi:hypothetical protein